MKNKLTVLDQEINIIKDDYICLTDMVKNIENGLVLIEKWLRNKNTIEFLGIWEEIYNTNFNSPEFEGIKNEAGFNRFSLSVKMWINKTNAIGIVAKAGRYGGTYAHKDIAFEFASWISPKFKLYLIKEFQRLKLVVMANLESLNAQLIKQNISFEERLVQLNKVAIEQLKLLLDYSSNSISDKK